MWRPSCEMTMKTWHLPCNCYFSRYGEPTYWKSYFITSLLHGEINGKQPSPSNYTNPAAQLALTSPFLLLPSSRVNKPFNSMESDPSVTCYFGYASVLTLSHAHIIHMENGHAKHALLTALAYYVDCEVSFLTLELTPRVQMTWLVCDLAIIVYGCRVLQLHWGIVYQVFSWSYLWLSLGLGDVVASL